MFTLNSKHCFFSFFLVKIPSQKGEHSCTNANFVVCNDYWVMRIICFVLCTLHYVVMLLCHSTNWTS